MTTLPVGSPDYQRGVVSSEKLLATVAAGTTSVVVAIPPNVTRIIVAWKTYIDQQSVTVTGNTTGMTYPGSSLNINNVGYNSFFYEFEVSPVIDDQVTVSIQAILATAQWYVLSTSDTDVVNIPALSNLIQVDNAVTNELGINIMGTDGPLTGTHDSHIISVDTNGRMVPLVPTVGIKVTVPAGTTQVISAPTSGSWYLFGIDVSITGGTTTPVTLIDSNGNTIAYDDPPSGGESHSINLGGFCTTGSVSVTVTTGATVVLRYAPGP